MPTLEKRINALESQFTTEHGVLVRMPRDDDTYEPVPAGFQGRVFKVVFVESPNALKEQPHPNT